MRWACEGWSGPSSKQLFHHLNRNLSEFGSRSNSFISNPPCWRFCRGFFCVVCDLRICRMGPFISKASGRKISSRNNCLQQRLLWAALSWDFSWLLQLLASFLAISPPLPHSLNIVGHCESRSAPLDFFLWDFFLSSRKANLAFHLFLRFKDCL